MNKKSILLFAAVGMVCLLGILPLAAAQTATVTIADASANHGQTTTAEIRAYNVTNLTGFTITLEYDPAVVMVIGETINSIFGANVSVISNNTNGSVILGSVSMDADVTSADVLLATVTLRADGNATEQSTLNITVDALINATDAQILPRSETDGTFTVSLPTVTIEDASTSKSQTTTAEIRAHNVTNLAGFTITLEYDPAVVMVIGETINPIFGANVSVISNNTNGSVILGSVSMDADVTSADVLLATVTLRADGNATEQSTLNITVDALLNTTEGQLLPRSVTNGTFTVVDANIVSIANVTLPYGSTQDVPIRLLNSTGVGAGQVILTFDESIVNTTTAVAGDFDSTFNADYSNVSNGVLRISCIKSGQNLTGDRTIATVTLHAVAASGTCGLNLSAELVMANGSDVSSTVSNGTFTIDAAATTTPPAPVSLQSTTGKYWVNYTWSAGSPGPVTDGYNVSLDNGSWYNRTTTSLNVTNLGAEGWANITVWAYNETGSGNMSVSSVSANVQAPADTVNISITLNGGWNLIAIPVYPLNNTVASVFAGVTMAGKSVYKYSGGYQAVTTIEPKVGYWVFSVGSPTIWIEGTPVTS
ncbi:MAG: hypothetical protein KAU52_01970 [Methanosarcinales archaeon]|nr:hypothetical protein [Methanosarcinales archaeon]